MRHIREFSILTVGHVLQGLILLASTRLITALLSPAEMGRFAIIYTIAGLFFSFFISPVSAYVQRNFLEWNPAGRAGHYSLQYVYYLFLSGLAAGVIVLAVKHIGPSASDINNGWSMALMFGLIFITYVNSFFCATLNLLKQRWWFVITSILTLGLGLIVSLHLVSSFARIAEYWITGQIIGQGIVSILAGALVFRFICRPRSRGAGAPRPSSILADVFRFSWPLALACVIIWVQSQSYRFLLERVSGIEVVGLFTVGFNLAGRLIGECESLLYKFYDPIFYAHIANGGQGQKAEAWNKYAKAFSPAIILICAFIAFNGPFIASVFVAPAFQKTAGDTLFWGGLAFLFSTMTSLYSRVGMAQSDMRGLIAPYLLGALVVLSCIYFLCPWDPYIGTGLALSLSALAILVYLMIKMHKLLPVVFPRAEVGLAFILLLPMLGIAGISRMLMPNASLWQSLAALFISGIYLLFAQCLLASKWLDISAYPLGAWINKTRALLQKA